MREAIARFDGAIDRAVDRVRSPAVDGVMYRISSAADHSLLWHFCGAVKAAQRGTDVGYAVRFAGAMGAESLLTNGVVKTAFRRVRPARYEDLVFSYGLRRPITTSFPSGHATAAFCAAVLPSRFGWRWSRTPREANERTMSSVRSLEQSEVTMISMSRDG